MHCYAWSELNTRYVPRTLSVTASNLCVSCLQPLAPAADGSLLGISATLIDHNRQEPVHEEPVQKEDCKLGTAEARQVLKEVVGQQSCERHSQKALLIMSARCQQLEKELAAAHTKVCDGANPTSVDQSYTTKCAQQYLEMHAGDAVI